jgi:uncharacterized membrane protein YdjX (TVP38/TMEM64 family)
MAWNLKLKLHHIHKFRYPKLALFILCIIFAYIIFRNPDVSNFIKSLGNLGYLGIFIAGMFFTFGFTTPFSVGFFISLNPSNIWLSGILGGLGALAGDLFIFKFVRMSFMDEFKRLENTKLLKEINHLIASHIKHKIKVYLLYIFAGILIASPLPDEAGVLVLAGFSHIKIKMFMLISFIFNTSGILIMLLI